MYVSLSLYLSLYICVYIYIDTHMYGLLPGRGRCTDKYVNRLTSKAMDQCIMYESIEQSAWRV